MDRVGLTGAGNNIRSVKARGAYKVIVKLKTPDSQFIAATMNRLFVVPRARLVAGQGRRELQQHEAGRLGPVQPRSHASPSQDYVFNKNPRYWQKGKPKVPCLEYVQASSNDAALALIQSGRGRLDAQLRSERREGLRREGHEALPRLLCDDGISDLAAPRHLEVPVQPRPVPQGAQPRDRPQDGVEAR